MQQLKALGSWVGVAMALSAVTACGDKGQLTGRGAAKPPASTPAATTPPSALPTAFRSGKSAEELLKLMPPLPRRWFTSSLVVFRLRQVLGAWSAVHRRLRADRLGSEVLREVTREARRAGALLPTNVADAERWGINVDGPAFAVLASYSRAPVVGFSVSKPKQVRIALEQIYGRGRAASSWEREQGAPGKRGAVVEVLKVGSSSRAFCQFSRGFVICSRRAEALRRFVDRKVGESI